MRPAKVSGHAANLGRLIFLPFLLLAPNAFPQNPVPFVNQPLVPSAVAPGGPDFTLTVNGTGFVSGATVNWNGTPLTTTFVSSSQLTATVPASNIAAAGTASITVVNPAPGGGRSNVAYLEVRTGSASVPFDEMAQAGLQNGAFTAITADLNGDGKLDIALADIWRLDVALGNGDGTFGPSTTSNVEGLNSVATGDFNGDGKLDVACGISGVGLAILLGNGDGTFQAAQAATLSGLPIIYPAGPNSVVTGDFNKDGILDVALASNFAQVFIYWGKGDGTFSTWTVLNSLASIYSLVVGDFNGDGNLDLAGATWFPASCVTVWLGNGNGGFGPPVTYSAGSGHPYSLVAADFNGDGKLDLVTAGSGSVSLLLGNGDGTFQPPVLYYAGGGSSQFLATGDFNGDGKLDLATSTAAHIPYDKYDTYTPFALSVLLGNGDGTFQTPAVFSVANSVSDGAFAVGNFDGDGRLDAVTDDPYVLLQAAPVDLFPRDLKFSDQVVQTASPPQTLTLTNHLV